MPGSFQASSGFRQISCIRLAFLQCAFSDVSSNDSLSFDLFTEINSGVAAARSYLVSKTRFQTNLYLRLRSKIKSKTVAARLCLITNRKIFKGKQAITLMYSDDRKW